MFPYVLSELTHTSEPTRPSSRSRFKSTMLPLLAMVLFVGASLFPTWPLAAQSSQNANYAWTLKSGLFTSAPDEVVRVLLTEVTESNAGVAVVVRFFDHESNLLEQSEGIILPGEPVMAKFHNDTGELAILRIEIDLLSNDPKVIPVTTLEVDRPGDLTIQQRFSCAGPMVNQPVEFNCEDDQDCPPPPVSEPEFNCPELVPFTP